MIVFFQYGMGNISMRNDLYWAVIGCQLLFCYNVRRMLVKGFIHT